MPTTNIVAQVGPVRILRASNGCWRWWCANDNATSMGSILPDAGYEYVKGLALAHVRKHHPDVYRRLHSAGRTYPGGKPA